MWQVLFLISKAYFFFVVAFSIYGAVTTNSHIGNSMDELFGSIIVGLFAFPLYGFIELFGEPSVHTGNSTFELMKINSFLFWLNLILFGVSGSKVHKK